MRHSTQPVGFTELTALSRKSIQADAAQRRQQQQQQQQQQQHAVDGSSAAASQRVVADVAHAPVAHFDRDVAAAAARTCEARIIVVVC